MRTLTTFALVACIFLGAKNPALAQLSAKQSQAEQGIAAMDKRIEQAQENWQRDFDSIRDYSMAQMPKWNKLVGQRERELDQLRRDRAKLVELANKEYSDKATDLNRQIKEHKASNLIAGSNMDFLNNLARNPKRQDFEANKQKMASDWDGKYGPEMKRLTSDEAKNIGQGFKKWFPEGQQTGYSRIGVHNPYTGDYYVKFYDEKGNWKFSAWKEGYEGWSRYREDSNTYSRRLSWERDDLLRRADDARTKLDRFLDTEDKAANELGNVKQRLDEAAKSPSAEEPPQQPQEQAQEPPQQPQEPPQRAVKEGMDSDGVFWREEIPDLDRGKLPPGWTGARWVNGRKVIP
jgi:hypothetical protein